jgi:hypothetical protein
VDASCGRSSRFVSRTQKRTVFFANMYYRWPFMLKGGYQRLAGLSWLPSDA